MPTHYEVLGVDPGADTETIRRAYLVVAKATHPDRRQSEDPDRAARAAAHIRLANAAWSTLRDPAGRAEYDAALRRRDSGPVTSAAPRAAAGPSRPPAERPYVGPPSGIVVPAAQASLWRYAPIVVVMVVLIGLLVFSAYATSKDSGPGTAAPKSTVPEVGECVLVRPLPSGRAPAPVACGTEGSYRIAAVVDTPRPCPTGSEQLPLSDQKTTLCLVPVG